jgi:hypothetical protein
MRTIAALLNAAEREAAELGDATPGAEHLLAAAAELDDSVAHLQVTTSAVRTAIRAVHARALGAEFDLPATGPATRGPFRGDTSLQQVFQRVRTLSKAEPLTALHVFRAAAEREHGTVALVIDELGLDRDAVLR